jgi:hypothetical protein
MPVPTRVVIAALAITIGATTAPAPAHAGKPPAVLSSLPDDTTVLAGVDVKKAIKAPIMSGAIEMLKQKAADRIDGLKAMGFDLEKDVTKLYVAIIGASLADADNARLKVLVAEGKFKIDPDKLGAETKTHQGVTYYTVKDSDFAVISKRLYVVSDGKMPDLLDVVKGKAKNAAKSPAAASLRTALGSITTTTAGWMVATVSEVDRKTFGATAEDMEWFAISGGLRADAVDVVVKVGLTSADAATKLADAASGQLAMAKQGMPSIGLGDFANSLTIGAKGTTLSVTASVTKAEMATIAGMASMFSPGAKSSGSSGPPLPPPTPAPGAKQTP